MRDDRGVKVWFLLFDLSVVDGWWFAMPGCDTSDVGRVDSYDSLGKALVSLISSDEGGEVVHRVAVAAFSGLPWCRSVIPEVVRELNFLSSDCLKIFAVQARSFMTKTNYGVVEGVISPILESLSFVRFMTYCDPYPSMTLVCCRLKQIRYVVGC